MPFLGRAIASVACVMMMSGGASASSAAVEKYPDAPVRMFLPFPAGGVTDVMMRKIGERFRDITGQTMVIQNRPGRTNALSALVSSPADGYTLSLVGRSQMINYWLLGEQMPFDPIKDVTWIDTLALSWFGLFVANDSPYQSVEDLLAAAKKAPDSVSYGTAFGVGGLTHAPMTRLSELAGVKMLYIPYKGDAESLQALMAGQIQAVVAAGTGMAQVQSGRLRLLAWVSGQTHPDYPQVKTLKDLGYDVEAYSVVGLGGPKDMDPALVSKISGIFQRILSEPETRKYMMEQFQYPQSSNPADFKVWAEQQLDKEREILQRFGLLDKPAK